MSLMSLQVFVHSAELAHTDAHTYRDAQKRAENGKVNLDGVQALFRESTVEWKGIKKEERGVRGACFWYRLCFINCSPASQKSNASCNSTSQINSKKNQGGQRRVVVGFGVSVV